MSTETTRDDLTREEIERVISDIIGAEDVRIIRHGIGSGDPSEVYGWVYESEDEHPYREVFAKFIEAITPIEQSEEEISSQNEAIRQLFAQPDDTPTPDALFDPEAEGWEPRADGVGGTLYDDPHTGCVTFTTLRTGLTALLDLCDGITLYHGNHPTTALVHEIIRLNGGGA